jgi:cob(I)alamin adenosyltransferase
MKIYTRKGDKGMTSLIGGKRVPKYNLRIESYGTVDELNSYLGILRSFSPDENTTYVLSEVQDRLFTIGSLLASAPDSKMIVPDIHKEDIDLLEKEIDTMNEVLPELKSFILPAGNAEVSHCHVARCVCRRAERYIVELSENDPVEPLVIAYINRLSDYLFVLARYIGFKSGIEECAWKPRT